MFFFGATVFEVSDEMNLLNESNATGIDKISGKVIKLGKRKIYCRDTTDHTLNPSFNMAYLFMDVHQHDQWNLCIYY